ncbi:MAG: hypothetical protein BWX88_04804 [Planctomycetes bacterium ADurb.Bin126]|nr:MAG: hypothetical protein BWX88_04804 [Planctomycetes bacterium ADurb.Bin126]HOD81981.1 hypothetical protein [Phycisphaerae bacterium]HQL74271.1 hypothetical protein [Phycisphaerae bacterium]
MDIRTCLSGLVLLLGIVPSHGLAQEVSRVTLSKGWATFGLSLPPGAVKSAVKVASFDTQTDVKNRWPDGSIRFAVVTCNASKAGEFEIASAPAGPGSFSPIVPAASVDLDVQGTVYTARLGNAAGSDRWLSGPLVEEWRQVVVPAYGSANHGQLRVLFDTRVYRDGQARLDVTVENVLDALPASSVVYGAKIVANGKTLYAQGPINHIWLARWRRTFDVALAGASVVHDFTSAIEAHAIPNYWKGIADKATPSVAKGFDPMGLAGLTPSMCDCGGRPEMAPYPDWAAEYLVHQRKEQKAFVLRHGEQAGSWPMHLREPDAGRHCGVGAGRYTSLDQRPDFWFDNRGKDHPAGPVSVAYARWGQGVPVPDIAHQPSLAFIPYLVTGDRYFVDEMAFWANFCLLGSYEHEGAQALIHHNELRGIAWATRNLADAAAYMPDGEAMKKYLEEKLRNNLAWFDQYAKSHKSPLDTVFEKPGVPSHEKHTSVSYGGGYGQLAWAIDRANRLGYPGGTMLRDRLSRFVLRLFTSEPAFPRNAATPLWLHVGPAGKEHYYTTLSQLAAANPGGDSMYAHWVRLALVIAVENKFPRAQEAYDYNWKICQTGAGNGGIVIRSTGGWAVLPDAE